MVKKFEQAFGEKLEYVPNGVNVEHYRHVPELKKNRPHPRPVLTYMGGMGVWFDHELVAAVAEELRDWDILLIGPTYFGEAEKQRLALPNIQFTGLLPYESLPEILAGSDVGMIPFGISQLVNGFSPLKLYEYLAAGLPVVATPMPEVLPFVEPGVVACTDDPRRFAQAARELLAGAQSRRCQQVAEQHSWRSRFAKALANIL